MTNQQPVPSFQEGTDQLERLRFALRAAQVGTWDLDIPNQLVWWDDRCKELYGFRHDDIVPYEQVLQYMHPDDQDRVDQAVQRALNPASDGHYDIQFRTVGASDGRLRWLHCQGKAYFGKDDTVYRFSGIAQDITAEVQGRQELETSRAQFRDLIASSPTATVVFEGLDMRVARINQPMLRIWGKDKTVVGKSLLEAVPELVGQPFLGLLQHVYKTGEPYHNPEGAADLMIDGKLQTFWFNFSYNPLYNESGDIYGVINTAVDVTDRVRAQQKNLEAKQRILSSFEQVPVAIALIEEEGLTFRMANQFYCQLVGRTPEQIVDKTLAEALPELQGQGFDTLLRQVIRTGEPYMAYERPIQLDRQNGLETVYVDFIYQPWRYADGPVSGVLVAATDVTPQVNARQRVQTSEGRFRQLIEESPFSIAVYETPELIISTANQAMIQLWGKTPAVIGKPLAEALPELEGQPFIPLLQTVYTTGQAYRTTEQPAELNVDGRLQTFWFNFVYHPLRNESGEVYGIINTAIDVTEKYLARQELQISEQRYRDLAADLDQRIQERTQELMQANQDLKRSNENLQQFAYIASHDLQEPLRKIQSFSSLLTQQLGEQLTDASRDYIQRITSASARMSMLIKDLLAYSRLSTRQQVFVAVPLDDLVADVLNTLEWEITQREARIDVDALPTVTGDESQLRQLFQNLLSNALKFARPQQKPTVKITSQLRQRNELPDHVRPASEAATFYQISVRDEGVGFDVKYLDRIFQVFQRLHGKNEFPGSGVGLAICQRVVENQGGAITAMSQPNQGATFLVYLPA